MGEIMKNGFYWVKIKVITDYGATINYRWVVMEWDEEGHWIYDGERSDCVNFDFIEHIGSYIEQPKD